MSRPSTRPVKQVRTGTVRAVRYIVDGLLAATPPALLAVESLLRMQGEAFEATLEGLLGFVLLAPWAGSLPVVVGLWLHRSGLPSPG